MRVTRSLCTLYANQISIITYTEISMLCLEKHHVLSMLAFDMKMNIYVQFRFFVKKLSSRLSNRV